MLVAPAPLIVPPLQVDPGLLSVSELAPAIVPPLKVKTPIKGATLRVSVPPEITAVLVEREGNPVGVQRVVSSQFPVVPFQV
jgi:hypothetical protein